MMENAKRLVSDLTGIGVALIALGVVLGVVIGTDVAFFGGVLDNTQIIMETLGSEGLGLIIAIIIILSIWNSRSN
ncbi:hypothetical protein M9C81_05715 [SAR86 cluster bacterium]|nr:hypothetical protein M9C81_05715 [SAR86 cluster bacterium]